jgi:addiction module RelB/DinJ family antitoxin
VDTQSQANVSAQIDPELKHQAEQIFEELGLTAAQAITLFYKQVEIQRGLPFPLQIPAKAKVQEPQGEPLDVHFHGVDLETGQTLYPAQSLKDLAELLAQEFYGMSTERKSHLSNLYTLCVEDKLGVREGYDPLNIDEAGWGILYAPDTPQAIKDALQPLVEHRTPAGQIPRTYTYAGETASQFRLSHDQGAGAVDPEKLPYYLLLVGPPTAAPGGISFEFQYELDAEHAVGRLYFEQIEDYGTYAQRVVAYETSASTKREKRIALLAPERDKSQDRAIWQSAWFLARPLANWLNGRAMLDVTGKASNYAVESKIGASAGKAALWDLISRNTHQPSLIFTATHGLGDSTPPHHKQGALLCQEYPGADVWPGGPIPITAYLSGEEILPELDLSGLIWFAYACHGAGSPASNNRDPFLAYLPQRLLAQGALAFIGHVGKAWSYSYGWPGGSALTATFEDTLEAIMKGKPVGHAFEYFNRRYLDMNQSLTHRNGLVKQYLDFEPVEQDLAQLGTACKDARDYILIGDPAVRLNVEAMS